MNLTIEEIKLLLKYTDIGSGFREEQNPLTEDMYYICDSCGVEGPGAAVWLDPPDHKPDCEKLKIIQLFERFKKRVAYEDYVDEILARTSKA